jgi:ubiquitin C-terminal hydrolase
MRFLYILLPLIYCADPTRPEANGDSNSQETLDSSPETVTPSSTNSPLELQPVAVFNDEPAMSPAELALQKRRQAYEAAMARIGRFGIGASRPLEGAVHRPTAFSFDLPARAAAPLSSLRLANKGPGHRGLSNLGMTCFINAAVQVLMNPQPIRELLRGLDSSVFESSADASSWKMAEKLRLAKSFTDLTHLYWSGDNTTDVNLTDSIRAVVTSLTALDPGTFVRGRMGDSHEVIKAIVEAFPAAPASPHNPLEFLFQVVAEQKMKFCTVCERSEKSQYEPLQDLLVKTELVGDSASVDLQEYVSSVLGLPVSETIDGVECTACSTEAGETVTRPVRLDTATVVQQVGGSLLLVTLPRFRIGSLLKNKVSVEIPRVLTLGDIVFDVVGVVHHSGSTLNFGHYTASFVDQVDGKWYKADDQFVEEIDAPVLAGDTPYLVVFTRRLV